MIVAVRAGPLFAAAVNLTVPFPDPVAPAEIVSQSASLFADHAQPLSPCTSNDPCPPPASTDVLVGLTVNVQPWPWFTVNVRPAIVAVPERFGPVVAATVNCTVPLPLDGVADAIAIHGSLLAAVQAQPAPA